MGQGTADEPLAPDDLEHQFGPAAAIEDELLTSSADVPLVEPQDVRGGAAAPSPVARALWFCGAGLLLLVLLQAAQLVHPLLQPAPGAAPWGTAPPPPAAGPATTPATDIDQLLRTSRVQLTRGLYEDVVRIIEPLAKDPARLDRNQRFEACLLLARAHRALDHVEQALQWQSRATDQAIERREPAQVLAFARTLVDDGRFDEARRALFQVLARSDSFTERDRPYLSLAEARVADSWAAQAQADGDVPALPGLTHERSAPAEPAR